MSDDTFPLLEKSITDLQEMMVNGTYSCEEITQLYLERITAIDENGPTLNSVIEAVSYTHLTLPTTSRV